MDENQQDLEQVYGEIVAKPKPTPAAPAAPKKSHAVAIAIVVAVVVLAVAIILVGWVVPAQNHQRDLTAACDAKFGQLTQIGDGDPICLTYN